MVLKAAAAEREKDLDSRKIEKIHESGPVGMNDSDG